jgi:hypothetical protein
MDWTDKDAILFAANGAAQQAAIAPADTANAVGDGTTAALTAGTPLGGNVTVNTTTAGNQAQPSIAALADGGYVVIWSSANNGIWGQRYNASGGTVGGEFQVHTSTNNTSRNDPTVAGLPDGGFVVSWDMTNPSPASIDVYMRRFDANGVGVGAEARVNTYTTDRQDISNIVVLADGSFVIAWQSNEQFFSGLEVYGQRYSAAGAPVGAEFWINYGYDTEQGIGGMAALSNGDFVATYMTFNSGFPLAGIPYFTRFSPAGQRLGTETQIANGTYANELLKLTVAGLDGGGFVLGWVTQPGDFVFQRFQNNGAPIDLSPVTINARVTPTAFVEAAHLLALPGGGFVAMWDTIHSTADTDIYAQVFNASGAPVGSRFLVHQTSTAEQEAYGFSLMTVLENGTLVFAWEGTDASGSTNTHDIFVRRFDIGLGGPPPPPEEVTNDFNFDGVSDVLWRNTSGELYVWNSQNTDGAFLGQTLGLVGNDWDVQATGDYNGDGQADILFRNTDGRVYLYHSTGSASAVTFQGQGLGTTATDWSIVQQAGDFNADGRADVLWRNTSGEIYLWESQGTSATDAAFQGHTLGLVANTWQVRGVDDFNGDGRADILWRNNTGDVYVSLAQGGAQVSLQGQSISFVPNDWTIQGTGDFNGDGRADILWRNVSGEVYVWNSNTGSDVSFVGQSLGMVANDWSIADIGDLNGDGRADVLFRHTNGDVYAWNSHATGAVAFDGQGLGNTPVAWQIISDFHGV